LTRQLGLHQVFHKWSRHWYSYVRFSLFYCNRCCCFY